MRVGKGCEITPGADMSAPPNIGATTPATGKFSTLEAVTSLKVGSDTRTSLGAQVATGNFSRDISLATNQSVTGLGFTPRLLFFFSSLPGAPSLSFGAWSSNGGHVAGAVQRYSGNADISYNMGGANNVVTLESATNAYNNATVASADADGFTLSWVKNGSPTGTGYVSWLAVR